MVFPGALTLEPDAEVDPRVDGNPLLQTRIRMGPRTRVVVQVLFSFVMVYAIYLAYKGTGMLLATVKPTGHQIPPEMDVPAWFLVVVPIVAIVPGVYIFKFMKFNFRD